MPTSTPTLRCGFCNAQGINQLEAQVFGFYSVIFCRQCGAIHGIVPAPPARPDAKAEAPEPVEPPQQPEPPFDFRAIEIENIEVEKPKTEPKLTPARAQGMMSYYIQPGSTNYRIIRKDNGES